MEEITIVEIKPQRVLGMRKRGKYEMIATMLPHLCEFAIEKGMQIQGMPIFICHEITPEKVMEADEAGTADVEVAIPVAGTVEETEKIKAYELPGGTMAKIVHKGPYEECGPTYEKLFAWLAAQGKTIVAPTREVYLNDPHEVPPEEILTEIYAPIE
jgi:AraC family transcriptional regulator